MKDLNKIYMDNKEVIDKKTNELLRIESLLERTYYSNANWSKINDTSDKHCNHDSAEENKAMAFSVCWGLMDNYGNGKECEVRGECLDTWVTNSKGEKVSLLSPY